MDDRQYISQSSALAGCDQGDEFLRFPAPAAFADQFHCRNNNSASDFRDYVEFHPVFFRLRFELRRIQRAARRRPRQLVGEFACRANIATAEVAFVATKVLAGRAHRFVELEHSRGRTERPAGGGPRIGLLYEAADLRLVHSNSRVGLVNV